jgi:hypothetical protein
VGCKSFIVLAWLLVTGAQALAAETVRVNALDCVLQIPADFEFHVAPDSSLTMADPRGFNAESIRISGLDPSIPSSKVAKLRQRRVTGPLTVDRYDYDVTIRDASRLKSFSIVRGRKQQIQFDHMADTKVDAYVAQCMDTMDPALIAGAARRESGCKATLTMDEVSAAFGAKVGVQPVFSGGGLKGWRLYNVRESSQLLASGIREGEMMSAICGVPGREVFADEGNACCGVDVADEFEVTFQRAGKEMKVVVQRGGRDPTR